MSAPKTAEKKGEVNELLTLLRAVNSSKEAPAAITKKKREVLKKGRGGRAARRPPSPARPRPPRPRRPPPPPPPPPAGHCLHDSGH